VLACVKEMASIYRAHNTYPHLLALIITGNPEQMTDREIAEKAREISMRHAKKVIRERIKLVEKRATRILQAPMSHRLRLPPCADRLARGSRHCSLQARHDRSRQRSDFACRCLTIRAAGEVLPAKSSGLPNGSPGRGDLQVSRVKSCGFEQLRRAGGIGTEIVMNAPRHIVGAFARLLGGVTRALLADPPEDLLVVPDSSR
jgi:hypothetical protein